MALIKSPIKQQATTGIWSVKDAQGIAIYDEEDQKGKRAELLSEWVAWEVFLRKTGPDAVLLKGGEKMAEKRPELTFGVIALPPDL
jgi:hypothetical protein